MFKFPVLPQSSSLSVIRSCEPSLFASKFLSGLVGLLDVPNGYSDPSPTTWIMPTWAVILQNKAMSSFRRRNRHLFSLANSHSFTYVDGDTQVELAEAWFTSEQPSRRMGLRPDVGVFHLRLKCYKLNH